MRKEGTLSFKERFFDHSMLGWIKKQRKRQSQFEGKLSPRLERFTYHFLEEGPKEA